MYWLIPTFFSCVILSSIFRGNIFVSATVLNERICMPLNQCDYYLDLLNHTIAGLEDQEKQKEAKESFLQTQACGLDVNNEEQNGNSNVSI